METVNYHQNQSSMYHHQNQQPNWFWNGQQQQQNQFLNQPSSLYHHQHNLYDDNSPSCAQIDSIFDCNNSTEEILFNQNYHQPIDSLPPLQQPQPQPQWFDTQQTITQQPQYITNYTKDQDFYYSYKQQQQPQNIDFTSTVFPIPQNSLVDSFASSSVEQSPLQLPLDNIDDLDLILNELENIETEDFLVTSSPSSSSSISQDELLFELLDTADVVESVGSSNNFDNTTITTINTTNTFLEQNPQSITHNQFADNWNLNTPNSSIDLSTDSSDYYCSSSSSPSSSDYFETPSSSPSYNTDTGSSCSSVGSSSNNSIKQKKRFRRCKHTKEERVARKKDQNKKAALKYREKKKFESEINENVLEQLEQRQNELTQKCSKIETEFDVLIPLAKAAFQHDPIRGTQLQQLLIRLSNILKL